MLALLAGALALVPLAVGGQVTGWARPLVLAVLLLPADSALPWLSSWISDRVDRVWQVSELEESFEPPADLDPVTVLEENFALGWEFPAEVLIEAPPDQVQPWLSRTIGRLEPAGVEGTRLLGSTSDPQWYAEVLAALPMPFRVVGGPELRAAVRSLGERMLAAATEA